MKWPPNHDVVILRHPDGKDMSCARLGTAVRKPCVKWLTTMEYICNINTCEGRIIKNSKRARDHNEVMGPGESDDHRSRSREKRMVVREAQKNCLFSLSRWKSALKDNWVVVAVISS